MNAFWLKQKMNLGKLCEEELRIFFEKLEHKKISSNHESVIELTSKIKNETVDWFKNKFLTSYISEKRHSVG
jgi:hypothetical protein